MRHGLTRALREQDAGTAGAFYGFEGRTSSLTTDDLPPDKSDGVVMRHSVTYVNPTGTTGSGTASTNGTLDVCVPALRK